MAVDITNHLIPYTQVKRMLAKAWDEGAEFAWQRTGEGWNGEYAGKYGTHDGDIGFLRANGDHNPYRDET